MTLVTFSRPAADEMRKRLAKAIGTESANKVRIGTYHGLSHDLLRAHYKKQKKEYRVIKDRQAKALILSARDRVAQNIRSDEAIAGVARIKATIRTDEEVLGRSDPLSLIYLEYQSLLRDLNGKDFADLIRETNQLFASGELRPYPIKYLLGDEFQDSDRSQYDWILAHAKAGAMVTAVGDDDQSIYGFRNAMGHIALRSLASDLAASIYFLNTNYRCGENIVLFAGQVIRDNIGRIDKQFKVGSRLAGEISVTSYRDAAAEAEGIIKQFEELVNDPSFTPTENEFAAMHRTNYGLDYLDMAAVGCAYRVVREGGSTFIDRTHVSQALSILRLAKDPNDKVSWHDAVNLAGMSPEGISHFEGYIRKLPGKSSMIDAVYAKEWLDRLGKQDKTLFNSFRAVVVSWIEGIVEIAESAGGDDEVSLALMKACTKISELSSNRFHRQDIQFLGRTLSMRLKGAISTRLTRIERKRSEPEEDVSSKAPVLKLMTFHGSKGLQFDAVFLTGINEGALPMENADIEEERRLLYVGITRAISHLFLSYQKSPEQVPSRYLDRVLKGVAAA